MVQSWSVTPAFDRLLFEPIFDVEVGPEFPGDGQWREPVHGFDRDGAPAEPFDSRWGPPLVLRVDANPAWIGSFPAGGLGGISGVFACPSPSDLCVVADGLAYLLDVRKPEQGATIARDQLTQVTPLKDPPLLVLTRCIDLVAIGPNGIQWRTSRLAVDELCVRSASSAAIVCTGYNLGGEAEILVDPATGAPSGGSALSSGWPDK